MNNEVLNWDEQPEPYLPVVSFQAVEKVAESTLFDVHRKEGCYFILVDEDCLAGVVAFPDTLQGYKLATSWMLSHIVYVQ